MFSGYLPARAPMVRRFPVHADETASAPHQVRRFPALERRGDVPDHDEPHVGARLHGGAADMGRHDYVVQSLQPRFGVRLVLEHVEPRAQ